MLGKAIFALTAKKNYSDDEFEVAVRKWPSVLEKALTDPLGALIAEFDKSVRDLGSTVIVDHDYLIELLRKASDLRNVLCHGSWKAPDNKHCSVPFFC